MALQEPPGIPYPPRRRASHSYPTPLDRRIQVASRTAKFQHVGCGAHRHSATDVRADHRAAPPWCHGDARGRGREGRVAGHTAVHLHRGRLRRHARRNSDVGREVHLDEVRRDQGSDSSEHQGALEQRSSRGGTGNCSCDQRRRDWSRGWLSYCGRAPTCCALCRRGWGRIRQPRAGLRRGGGSAGGDRMLSGLLTRGNEPRLTESFRRRRSQVPGEEFPLVIEWTPAVPYSYV